MEKKIKLSDEEKDLYDSLKILVGETIAFYNTGSDEFEIQEKRYSIMAKKAHELHMLLKEDGNEPRHHKYMYVNRGVPADKVEFYNHLHPVEDLLSFIEDPDSTADPKDVTMNECFDFKIYTRRWGHDDYYTLTRVEKGWHIEGASAFNNNDADKSGHPSVFAALKHDTVSYPYNIGELLEWVWEKAAEGETKETIQNAINDIANWISLCEENVPRGIFKELL